MREIELERCTVIWVNEALGMVVGQIVMGRSMDGCGRNGRVLWVLERVYCIVGCDHGHGHRTLTNISSQSGEGRRQPKQEIT
jgi:hypothetical protein